MSAILKFGNKAIIGGDSRPTVALRVGKSPVALDEIEALLIVRGAPFYQRGGRLVRTVTPDSLLPGVKRDPNTLVLHPVAPPHLREMIDRSVRIERHHKNRDGVDRAKFIDCPLSLAVEYLARGPGSKFPEVHGIARAPILRDDGSICASPGFDAATGLLLAIRGDMPMPPVDPTRQDALEAIDRLRAPVAAMPFRTATDESVFLAAVLTGIARPTLPAAPMFGFSAPTRGSGKSKLAEVVALIATGRRPAVVAFGHDPIESEKRLVAAILPGDPVIVLDNVEVPLEGDMLCQAITQPELKLRPLGSSEQVTVACTALLLATGNNLTIRGDMTRRVLVGEVDPGTERPELRVFASDPVEVAIATRDELVRDVLTVLVAARASGFVGPAPLGSFGAWSRIVRDALIWLDLPDPVEAMERTYKGDPERESAVALLSAWRTDFGAIGGTVSDAVARTSKRERDHHPALADALDGVLGSRLSTRTLGAWLRRFEGRIVEGQRVFKAGERQGATIWAVQDA